jgi:hypothetical protein
MRIEDPRNFLLVPIFSPLIKLSELPPERVLLVCVLDAGLEIQFFNVGSGEELNAEGVIWQRVALLQELINDLQLHLLLLGED